MATDWPASLVPDFRSKGGTEPRGETSYVRWLESTMAAIRSTPKPEAPRAITDGQLEIAAGHYGRDAIDAVPRDLDASALLDVLTGDD